MKYMYYCPECNKVFKAGETGKKIKCPKCKSNLSDLGISDQDYALLPAAEKEIMKQNMRVLNTAVNASDSLNAAINNNKEMLAQVKNNYLKMQIQNHIFAVDNFVSICTMSALKDDGKIDSDEAKLLKKLEKLTDDYKKGLNKLI